MRPDAGTAHRIRIVAARLTRQVYVGVLAAIRADASKAADVLEQVRVGRGMRVSTERATSLQPSLPAVSRW